MKMPLIALVLLLAGGQALAQSASREQEQIRRLRAQAQQLQQTLSTEQQQRQAAVSELQALKQSQGAELQKLGEEARSARLRAGNAQKQTESLQRELNALRTEKAALESRLERLASGLSERERELGETRGKLAGSSQELELSKAVASQLSGRLAQCTQDNLALYSTGIEMLDRWRDRTLGDRIAQGEPFAQVGRVKLENLVETWRDRLDEKRTGSQSPSAQ